MRTTHTAASEKRTKPSDPNRAPTSRPQGRKRRNPTETWFAEASARNTRPEEYPASASRRPHRHCGPVRSALACTAGLWAITGLATLAGTLEPDLALRAAPHPALAPTLDAWVAILAVNARVLCVPFLLSALGLGEGGWRRRLGDLTVLVLMLVNGGLVGVELGRWGTRLLPYLPQLPLEWLAAGTSVAVWLRARRVRVDHAQLAWQAALVLGLLTAAAAIEVLLTPHAS